MAQHCNSKAFSFRDLSLLSPVPQRSVFCQPVRLLSLISAVLDIWDSFPFLVSHHLVTWKKSQWKSFSAAFFFFAFKSFPSQLPPYFVTVLVKSLKCSSSNVNPNSIQKLELKPIGVQEASGRGSLTCFVLVFIVDSLFWKRFLFFDCFQYISNLYLLLSINVACLVILLRPCHTTLIKITDRVKVELGI